MLSTTLFAIVWVAMISGVAVWFNQQTRQQPSLLPTTEKH